ncbi:MAG: ABC transporter substrate-binding protein [Mariprofundus sp.]
MIRLARLILPAFIFLLYSPMALPGLVQAAASENIRIHLKWQHQFQFAGYYAALAKGFYADEGLNVSLIEGGPGRTPMQDLLSGQVHYCVADAGILLSRAEGNPVVVLASLFQHSPQVIHVSDKLKTPSDLRGKRVMMQQGHLTIEVQALLHHLGIQESEYTRLPIGSLDDLVEGRTDAWPGYSSNEGFVLEQKGFPFHIFRPRDYGIDFYGDTLVTTEMELREHPERAASLRRATIKGWEYALAHKQEMIALIKEQYDSQGKSVAHLTYEADAIDALMFPQLVPVGLSNLKRWQQIANAFTDLGYPVVNVNWDTFLYQPRPGLIEVIRHYRFWIGFGVLGTLLLLLYLFNIHLRWGIEKRTFDLENMSSEFQDILDHMQDAYYRTGLDGELIWVSLACERQMGYQRSELIGQPLASLYYETGARDKFLQALEKSGGDLQHFEVCLRHKDGSRVWAEVNSQYYYDAQGQVAGIEGNVRNINERKKAERESKELTDQLQQAQKMESIGVLAGGIAHDFNNLLVGVMGNAELAMLDTPEKGEMRQYLDQIFKSARRGADLVRQMLAYSGQGRFTMGEQNFNSLIKDVSELLSTVIGKQIKLDQALMHDLPDVYGDKNQLTQLIMNLMTNASEAMQGKPGKIHLTTGVQYLSTADFSGMYMASDLQQGDYAFMQVEDSGCGMDEQTMALIFDPFFTTKETGSGLGLAALLGIVHSHGGTLALHSEPGKGACFRVYLPVLSRQKAEAELQTAELKSIPDVRGAVLVVDDEEAVRDVARRLLEREGIQVLTANDGAEAVTVFSKYNEGIALVLMDLTIPEMDGEQAFHSIRALRSDAVVLLSSGFSETEAADRLRVHGLAGFVRKPYTRKTLLYEVSRLGIADIDDLDLDS